MIDPILGALKPDPHIEGCLLGVTIHDGRQVYLQVRPDGTDLESCLALAKNSVVSLGLLECKARIIATEKLLEDYNENWRSFQQVHPDGVMEEAEHPALSPDEFSGRLKLEGLSVTGDMLEFCFDDDGLFAGHRIFVSSFDGLSFTDTDATLFG
jgi:hypothetical protein